MKKILKNLFVIIILTLSFSSFAQNNVSVSDNESYVAEPSAMLDVFSVSKGMLVPRMTNTQINQISNPATGLLVFNIDEISFYFYNGSEWLNLSGSESLWSVNSSTNDVFLTETEKNVGIGTNNPVSKLAVMANSGAGPDDPLFEVQDEFGKTIFSVTSEGVRFYVKEYSETKGISGGFAVGKYGSAKGMPDTTYLMVTPDSTRVFTDSNAKGISGGFAVGKYGSAKGTATTFFSTNEAQTRVFADVGNKGISGGFAVGKYGSAKGADSIFFFTDRDSTRVYTETSNKGISGGFAVGKYGSAKGVTDNYLHMTKNNYLIGHNAGSSLTTGTSNIFVGYESGVTDTSGSYNVFVGHNTGFNSANIDSSILIGYQSGYQLTDLNSDNNIMIGYKSAYNSNGNYNTIMGNSSFYNNSFGSFNVAVGYEAMKINSGDRNVALGYQALSNNTNSFDNVVIGYQSLVNNSNGDQNIVIGYQALRNNDGGDRNIAIGSDTFTENGSGDDNVAIGDRALNHNDNGSNNIAIGQDALKTNGDGNNNIAIGEDALVSSGHGSQNIAIGDEALHGGETNYNIALGYRSAYYVGADCDENIFMGYRAGQYIGDGWTDDGDRNISIGYYSGRYLRDGDNNIFIGSYSGGDDSNDNEMDDCIFIGNDARTDVTGLENSIAFGNDTEVNSDNKIVIGNSSVSTIGGYANWSNYSDKRLKENIVYKNKLGLEFINNLKPVSFNYKTDKNKRRRDGLIAQDVQQTLKELNLEFSGLIIDNDEDKTLNIAYADFVIPLINSVKELNDRVLNLEEDNKKKNEEIEKLKNLLRK